MEAPLDECISMFPDTEIKCQIKAHPHEQAHYANGVHDGTRWSAFWWELAALRERPDDKADDRPWPEEEVASD